MSKNSSLNTTIGTTQFSSGPATVVTLPPLPLPVHLIITPEPHVQFDCTSIALHWQLCFHCTTLATALLLHYTGNCTSLATALHLQLHFTCNCASLALHWQLRFHCILPALATALPLHYTGNCAFVATVLLSASAIPACATANVTVVAIHRNPLNPWGPCDFHGHPCASFAPAFTYETKIVMQNPLKCGPNLNTTYSLVVAFQKAFPCFPALIQQILVLCGPSVHFSKGI